MRALIVITGLDQLPPANRWHELIAPLAAKLSKAGLGEVLGLAGIQRDFESTGAVKDSEITVRLSNLDNGLELVDQCVAAAGVVRQSHVMPERWSCYNCADYFHSEYATNGYQDQVSHFWYLVPSDRVFEDEERRLLVVGGAGAKGIQWGYRRGYNGFWAYPRDGAFVRLADTCEAFMRKWLAGEISV